MGSTNALNSFSVNGYRPSFILLFFFSIKILYYKITATFVSSPKAMVSLRSLAPWLGVLESFFDRSVHGPSLESSCLRLSGRYFNGLFIIAKSFPFW